MADESDEPVQVLTLQQRIAALNQAHIANNNSNAPQSRPAPAHKPARPTSSTPPIPSRRPDLSHRRTANVPPGTGHGSVADRSIGNEPAAAATKLEVLPPPVITRTGQKVNAAAIQANGSHQNGGLNGAVNGNAPPALPVRKKSGQPPPPPPSLPPRTASVDQYPQKIDQRRSFSAATSPPPTAARNRVLAPQWGDGELPPLPPPRSKETPVVSPATKAASLVPARVGLKSMKSTSALITEREVKVSPPPLPTRQNSSDAVEDRPAQPPRRLPPINAINDVVKNRPAIMGFSNGATSNKNGNGTPPPIPVSSRPDLSKIMATKPKPQTPGAAQSQTSHQHSSSSGCLKCRDFSAPDNHAAQFPRQSLPTHDLAWLAHNLTAPFPSYTDKARAIFTWLHHNISYNVEAFFNNNVQPSTPASTLATGLAVCEGYAALFTNLATHAGLESIVVGGHGKGFGFNQVKPGDPIPPYNTGHAWNAVRIDNGAWKLIDPCWGAGHIGGPGQPYQKSFSPREFTMTNDEFGLRHFPENREHFFRDDGRPSISWEEYLQIGSEPVFFFDSDSARMLGQQTFSPALKQIQVNSPEPIRFQFGVPCPYFSIQKNLNAPGPYVYILRPKGYDGESHTTLVFDYFPGQPHPSGTPGATIGDQWYLDVPDRRILGRPGQKLAVFAISVFGNDRKEEQCMGLTVEEARRGVGRMKMAFAGVAEWVLV